MKFRPIKKQEWKSYFEVISKILAGQRIELEVAGLDFGDQIEEEWVSLDGLSYDPKSDAVFIHTTQLDHTISEPQEIVAVEEGANVRSIAVKDASENVQVVHFREPLKLEGRREAVEPLYL